VDVIKVEVPSSATLATPWRLTRSSRSRYYIPVVPKKIGLDEPSHIEYKADSDVRSLDPDTDTYVLHVSNQISVTPLSLDLTSRVDLTELEKAIRINLER
jgi:5'-nucleotidase